VGEHLLAPGFVHGVSVEPDAAAPVVQVGQGAVVALVGDAPRETAELFADAGGVHVQHDDGERAGTVWVHDEGLHLAVGRADREVLFVHAREYGRAGAWGSSDRDHAAPIC